jgi:hypothetical protein
MNMMNALTRGVETTVSAQLLPRWQVHVSHAYNWKELTFDPGSNDPTHGTSEGNDPRNIFKLRSYATVSNRIEVDGFFRYVSSLPQPAVDAYTELDLRFGYRIRPGWDLSVIGTNLLHDRHLEFRAGTAPETYERAIALDRYGASEIPPPPCRHCRDRRVPRRRREFARADGGRSDRSQRQGGLPLQFCEVRHMAAGQPG